MPTHPQPPAGYWEAARTLTSCGRLDPLTTVNYQRDLRIQRSRDLPAAFDLEVPNLVRDLLCALALHANEAAVVAMDTRDLHLATGHGPDKIAAGLGWAEEWGWVVVYRGKRGRRLIWLDLQRPAPRALEVGEGPADRAADPKRSRGAADRARIAAGVPSIGETGPRPDRRRASVPVYSHAGVGAAVAPTVAADDDPRMDKPFPM